MTLRDMGFRAILIALALLMPSAVCAADLYVSSQGAGFTDGGVYKITSTGAVTEPVTGIGLAEGVAVDSGGNLYLAHGDIDRYTPAGGRSTFYYFDQTPLFVAWCLAFDRGDNLWVANADGLIDVLSPSAQRRTFATGLANVQGIAIDGSGDVFLADGLQSIYKFLPDGTRTTFATGMGGPVGLAFDPSGTLYASSANTGNIYKFTPAGARTTFATGLISPWGLACDSDGNLYAADLSGASVYKYTPGGSRTTFATGLIRPEFLAFSPQTFPVPEPTAALLIISGTIGFAGRRRRKSSSANRPNRVIS